MTREDRADAVGALFCDTGFSSRALDYTSPLGFALASGLMEHAFCAVDDGFDRLLVEPVLG